MSFNLLSYVHYLNLPSSNDYFWFNITFLLCTYRIFVKGYLLAYILKIAQDSFRGAEITFQGH